MEGEKPGRNLCQEGSVRIRGNGKTFLIIRRSAKGKLGGQREHGEIRGEVLCGGLPLHSAKWGASRGSVLGLRGLAIPSRTGTSPRKRKTRNRSLKDFGNDAREKTLKALLGGGTEERVYLIFFRRRELHRKTFSLTGIDYQ